MRFEFHPLTPDRWRDLERLFGPRGACGGCWCMYWRIKRSEYLKNKGARNRASFRAIVEGDTPPGVLAYLGEEPIAWCAVGPRSDYPVLENSRILKPVDDKPVWSITCLYVARQYRRQGVSAQLVDAAAKFARKHGARIVEGYPTEPKSGKVADAFIWTGLASAFQAAGFEEVARRSPTRPIMRRVTR